jgi:hypothetical protein
MAPGPVWRVIGAAETTTLAEAAAAGRNVVNRAPSPEPPGHRSCMLFAAAVCPFLARPNARRRLDVEVFGHAVTRGTARGTIEEVGGSVVGFDEYQFRYVPGEQVGFLFTGLTEIRPHALGAEQLDELTDVVAAEPAKPESPCPVYLLDDEAAATSHAEAILKAAIENRGAEPVT